MPAIAHQNKILGNTSGGGSTILVTTSESTLYGQTVTLSDGTTTLTGTFSNAGECEFTGVMMVGTLTATSGTASTSINVPYFGVYSIILSLFSATITATYPDDKGATCTCTGNGESYTASGSPYTFTVHGAGEYRVTATLDGKSITDVIQITTDGQSETATINFGTIVVTYDNAFRGLPITCTKDSSVYTKTAPSSGNTMYFYPNIAGNWVISGTVSGTPYSKTANVTSLSTSVSVSLETVPDGKTATPTDDIEKWLACGQITGKSYTTLSQVLSDAETYERLLSDSNACDYMARSTTWALAEGLVPQMTSATTPSGEVSASSFYPSTSNYYLSWKAFAYSSLTDSTDTGGWLPAANTSDQYVQYEFPDAQIIRVWKLSSYYGGNSEETFELSASNDSTFATSVVLGEIKAIQDRFASIHTLSVVNNTAYKYYRVTIKGTTNTTNGGIRCQFYADADITTSQDAMMRLGKYDYACDALLADSTWASAICNSAYFESVFDISVPQMTSNSTPSGTASASAEYNSSTKAWNAFDRNTSTGWTSGETTTGWVEYDFPNAVKVNYIAIDTDVSNNRTQTMMAQAYINSTWTNILDSSFTISSSDGLKVYPTSEVIEASKFRMSVSASTDNWPYISRLQFIGRHTAQTDIIVTAHGGDTVYYMENGSPVTLTTADSDTGIGTVDWSDLPKGAITLYSRTAKNPSDLTADYSKTVYVTEYTTQIYLMPETVPYWFGHKTALCEENGFTYSGSRETPTYNYTNVTCSISSSSRMCTINSKIPYSGNAKVIAKYTSTEGSIFKSATKAIGDATETKVASTNATHTISLSNDYVSLGVLNGSSSATKTMVIEAFFIEQGA